MMGIARRKIDVIRKVLLADDDEGVLKVVEAVLGNDGTIQIMVARDGDEAIAMAKEWNPDVIFLDVMMPNRNGYEVCRALKTNLVTSRIKVVMLTGLSEDGDRERAIQEGADDYITKPFSPVELFQKFEEMQGHHMPR